MNFRTSQAASSPTFTAPPIDGSLSIPEMWDYIMIHNSDHPLFVYEKNGTVQTIPWSEGIRAIHTAAHLVESILRPLTAKTSQAPIAVLAVTG